MKHLVRLIEYMIVEADSVEEAKRLALEGEGIVQLAYVDRIEEEDKTYVQVC